jgi:hypothetical protein
VTLSKRHLIGDVSFVGKQLYHQNMIARTLNGICTHKHDETSYDAWQDTGGTTYLVTREKIFLGSGFRRNNTWRLSVRVSFCLSAACGNIHKRLNSRTGKYLKRLRGEGQLGSCVGITNGSFWWFLHVRCTSLGVEVRTSPF